MQSNSLVKVSLSLLILLLSFTSVHSQNLVWAKQISGTDLNRGTAIALDASGNVYTLGVYRGTADFDPGVGVFNLTAKGNNDIFISKSNAAGDLIWALSMGDSAYDFGTSIAIDQSGNIYTTGCFSDIADFDPGTGIFNLTAVGSYDIFISKIDSSGNFVWAKQMGSPYFDFAYALALDDFGNVYSTGYFTDSADFDPGAGIFTMTSSGGRNVFISKLDSDGNFIWAKQFNGTGDDNCTAIKADALGNIYMTGVFNSTTDFDPGVLNYDLTSMGLNDNFIAKLDSSGNFQWAKQIGESGVDGALGLTLDHSANVITTGTFNGMCDFNPGAGTYNLTTIGNSDIYVSMLDSAGNFIWAKQMGGTANEYGAAITVDVSGNIYITGVFVGTCDFDPGSGIFNLNSSASSIDLFISKLDPSGNFQWALPFGGPLSERGSAIVTDPFGYIYSTGYFNDVVDFDPGAGILNFTSLGGEDVYISKLDGAAVSAMKENTAINFNLFPNPTCGKITIDLQEHFYSAAISVNNIIGQQIFSKKYSSGNNIYLNLEKEEAGVYFVELKVDDKASVIQKIIKQ